MATRQVEMHKLEFVSRQFESLPGSIFLTDPKSYILYGNNALLTNKSLELGQIVGRKPGQLWGGQMERGFYDEFWEIIGNKKKPFVGKMNNKDKQNNMFLESVYITPLCDTQSNIKYFLELNPLFSSIGAKEAFQEDFMAFWQQVQHNDIYSLNTLYTWLDSGRSGKNKIAEVVNELAEVGYTLNEALYTVFVVPTQNLFSNRTEDQLLIQAAQKNPDAFIELYLKYYIAIYYYFLKRLHNEDVAHDFAQETFLKAYKSLSDFKLSNASYYTFLKRVAHNLLLNYYRKKEDLLMDHNSIDSFGVRSTLFNLDHIFIWRAVDTLPSRYRDVFIKKYRDGMKIREIAKEYNKSDNAIKLILSRARKVLRGLLK